jgi:hypothetical protein
VNYDEIYDRETASLFIKCIYNADLDNLMDKDAEPIDNNTSDKNGALFYVVRTTCGSLRCPPYKKIR